MELKLSSLIRQPKRFGSPVQLRTTPKFCTSSFHWCAIKL